MNALVDTGADYSVISSELARKLKKVLTPWKGPQVRTAGGHLIDPTGKCTARIGIRGFTYVASFIVISECSRDLIIGMDFLQANGAVIDLRESRVSFSTRHALATFDTEEKFDALCIADDDVMVPPRSSVAVAVRSNAFSDYEGIADSNTRLLLEKGICMARGLVQLRGGCANVFLTNFGNEVQHVAKGTVIASLNNFVEVTDLSIPEIALSNSQDVDSVLASIDIEPGLLPGQKEQIENLIREFAECFSTSSKVRRTSIAKHRIIVDESVRPICQHPYRVSPKEREAIGNQVKEMLKDDVIQPSASPWASPVVLVKKKDQTLRFCIDYRKLNAVTKRDVYPLPRIDDTLDRLRDAKFFSCLDLKNGYWQIEVDERDREKTAFVTPDGLYEFKVLPFGLCSAPATFQRMMDTVLTGLKWQTCLVYLDDVVVFSATFEQHVERLRAVMKAIKSAGLTIKPQKCHFGFHELLFLGHVISSEGIRPDPEKTTAVQKFPKPTDKKAVRRFLGLCAYYRRFVKNFSRIAEPLTRLTKEDMPFVWSSEQENAFNELRTRLQNHPVLGHFDEEAETDIHTDASNLGLGAVLIQWQNGEERVIAYASRTLSKAEVNYSATEKECLAVIWAISKFRPYLYGRPFRAISDHHSLCWLANLKDPSGRLARWSLRLQEYDITVVYKSGHKHSDADCLSRAPIESTESTHAEDVQDCPFLGAVTSSQMAQHQQSDAELRLLIDHLEGRTVDIPRAFVRNLSSFALRNNVLYKRNFERSAETFLLVVPSKLRPEILEACHDDPSAGHLGVSRTFARIRTKYYWPKLLNSVQHYVRTCRDCQRRKTPPLKPAGLLQPIQPPEVPFAKVGMDLLGPFPTSSSGKRWIVVATDYLTRYAETGSLVKGTAIEVAEFFVTHIVLRHGAPKVVITDRGTIFTARLTQSIMKLTHTSHRKTTAYHPQTNGLTERLNRTLTDMLSIYVDMEHRTWDKILPYATFAYNTAVQETTQMTPFQLVFGRTVTTPLDAMLPVDETSENDHDISDFTERAEEARQLARHRIQQQQQTDANRYNLRRRDVQYAPGDRVWVWTPVRMRGLSEKLLRRYFGPYKIIRQLSPLNYEVLPEGQITSSRRRHRTEVVNVVRMKPYYDRQ